MVNDIRSAHRNRLYLAGGVYLPGGGVVLKAGMRRGVPVEIVEWPGGEPKQIDLDVTPKVFAAVSKGRVTVPLGNEPDLAEIAGLPWCSIATLRSKGDKFHRIVGPAIAQKDG